MIPWWGVPGGTGNTRDVAEILDRVTHLYQLALRRLEMASAQLEALRAQVADTKGVMESAGALIAGLHGRLEEAGTDPVALDEIKADLKTGSDALAAAVAANQ